VLAQLEVLNLRRDRLLAMPAPLVQLPLNLELRLAMLVPPVQLPPKPVL